MNARTLLLLLVLAPPLEAQARDSLKLEKTRIINDVARLPRLDSLIGPDTVVRIRVDTVVRIRVDTLIVHDTVRVPVPTPPPAPTPTPIPAPPPSTGATNEPAGFTLLTERDFAAKGDTGWKFTDNSLFSIVSTTSPRGDGKVGQALYPAGFVAGSGPIQTYFNVPGSYHQLYVGMWVKFSSNWQGQFDAINKVLFIWIDGHQNVFLNAQGSGSGPLVPSVNLQNNVGGAKRLTPNVVPGAVFTRGEWHFWEVLLVANTVGQLNGSAKWWLDGKLIGDWTGIGPAKTSSNRWEMVNWNPTWGGGTGTVTANMTMQADYIRVSGAP